LLDSTSGLKLSLYLPLLVVFLCAGVLLLWRFLHARALPTLKPPLRFLGRVELSAQHVLYVVEAGDRRLILGGAPSGLTLLTELPGSAEAPAYKGPA
jgi:flagellar biogenesis protein FliO